MLTNTGVSITTCRRSHRKEINISSIEKNCRSLPKGQLQKIVKRLKRTVKNHPDYIKHQELIARIYVILKKRAAPLNIRPDFGPNQVLSILDLKPGTLYHMVSGNGRHEVRMTIIRGPYRYHKVRYVMANINGSMKNTRFRLDEISIIRKKNGTWSKKHLVFANPAMLPLL